MATSLYSNVSQLITLLTLLALAVWCADDGSVHHSGHFINTQGFSYSVVYQLAGLLHYLYKLECNVHKNADVPASVVRHCKLFMIVHISHFKCYIR